MTTEPLAAQAAVDCSADGGHFTFAVEAGRQAYQADAWQDGRCACFAYGWGEGARAEDAAALTEPVVPVAASTPTVPNPSPEQIEAVLAHQVNAAIAAAGPMPSLAQPDPHDWLIRRAETA